MGAKPHGGIYKKSEQKGEEEKGKEGGKAKHREKEDRTSKRMSSEGTYRHKS